MKHYAACITLFFICCAFCPPKKENTQIDTKLTAEEYRLYNLLMEYRLQNNLPMIPLSKSLTYVAKIHSMDVAENPPNEKKGCNMHSWSKKGEWTGCCYTDDHKKASCIWDKPRELTSYKHDGFEIAYGYYNSVPEKNVVDAAKALAGWKKSTAHNNIIINKEMWAKKEWKAIGVGIYKGYAMVWFGEETDEAGEPER